jgi:hypothetical protein
MQSISNRPADAPNGEPVPARAVFYQSLAWILVIVTVTPLFVPARYYGLVAFLLGFALMLLRIARGILARQWILVGVAIAPILGLFVLGFIIGIPSLLHSHQAANESYAVANLTRISAAEVTYKSMSSSGGRYGAIQDLIDAKLLDDTFNGIKGGYAYEITLDATGSGYTAEAVPGRPEWGRYGYNSVSDAVVRYSTNASLAPYGQAGKSILRGR